VLDLLDQPDVTGLDARNLVERRQAGRSASPGPTSAVIERVPGAPRLVPPQPGRADIARQAAFVEPVPSRGDASVAVLPLERGRWRIEVAARDRPGLLATVSGVIADLGLDILDAAVATWGDGAALDTILVKRTVSSATDLGGLLPPDPGKLEAAIVAAFDGPLECVPNADAELRFDDHASPWYTICEVRSPDRRGLLHSLTAAMAAARTSVHSARLVTVDGIDTIYQVVLTTATVASSTTWPRRQWSARCATA
jgi:predicted amino acid-binding ACT domain protein